MRTLLPLAAFLKVLSAFSLKDGYSTWEAECRTSGISAHPADCRVFILCHTRDVQLFRCPPHSGYSHTQKSCLPLSQLHNGCSVHPTFDSEQLLELMPVTHTAANNISVCNPQGLLIGQLQCPVLAISEERCVAAARTCTSAESRELIQQNTLQTSSDVSLFEELNTEDDELPPVVCKQKGLHCADDSTIADCADVSEEPLFSMSCSSLLHDDTGGNVGGHCEEAACILSTQGTSLHLPVTEFSTDDPNVPQQFLNDCSQQPGLRCVDNQTLVACAGNLGTTNYAISCVGTGSNADTGLQGYCDEETDSCVILTPQDRMAQSLVEDIPSIHNRLAKESERNKNKQSSTAALDLHLQEGSLFLLQVLANNSSQIIQASHKSN